MRDKPGPLAQDKPRFLQFSPRLIPHASHGQASCRVSRMQPLGLAYQKTPSRAHDPDVVPHDLPIVQLARQCMVCFETYRILPFGFLKRRARSTISYSCQISSASFIPVHNPEAAAITTPWLTPATSPATYNPGTTVFPDDLFIRTFGENHSKTGAYTRFSPLAVPGIV